MLEVSKNPCTVVHRPVLWGRDVRRWKRKEDGRASPGPLFSQELLTLNRSLSHTHTHTHTQRGESMSPWVDYHFLLFVSLTRGLRHSLPAHQEILKPGPTVSHGDLLEEVSHSSVILPPHTFVSLQDEQLSSVHSPNQRGGTFVRWSWTVRIHWRVHHLHTYMSSYPAGWEGLPPAMAKSSASRLDRFFAPPGSTSHEPS